MDDALGSERRRPEGHPYLRLARMLEPGVVVTVEPGIYIPEENLAVRLEDDVLITETGTVNLTQDIPVEPDAVEAMMQGRKAGRRSVGK